MAPIWEGPARHHSRASRLIVNPTAAHKVAQNVKAEEALSRLHTIVEQGPVLIIITDLSGNIEYVNPKFTELTGYSFIEAIGKNPRMLQSGQTPKDVYKELWSLLKAGKTWTGDLKNKKKGGDYFWLHSTIAPIKDPMGNITHYLSIGEDATSRKAAEEALRREKTRVEELSRAKDEFMRTVTHELKTPLSVILGNLSMLRGMPPSDNKKKQNWESVLVLLERSSVRLRRSIEQILQLSKLDQTSIKKETVPLYDVMQDIYAEHMPLAKMKGLKISMEVPKLNLLGDPEMLRMALSNFVSNAIKFTEKGSISISGKKAGNGVCISISDTGIGLSPENQKKLFQRFFKANPDAPGTGIGLALSAEIIQKHRGKVEVKSALGKGTTFEIFLPSG